MATIDQPSSFAVSAEAPLARSPLAHPRYALSLGPIHRAVWDTACTGDEFSPQAPEFSASARTVADRCLAIVHERRERGALRDELGKVCPRMLEELAAAGYFGVGLPTEHGGAGASFSALIAFVQQIAASDPTTAGLLTTHTCIGAAGSIARFGTTEQQQRWLPDLAAGRKLACFAMTERASGSDMTSLQTIAVKDGDGWALTGEKVFITNAAHGRIAAVVCMREGAPAVAIVELPERDTPEFQLVRYGIHALKRTWNNGLRFERFPLRDEDFLAPGAGGNGLSIAYNGLNHGRTALCANAGGSLRILLAGVVDWAKRRATFGKPLAARDLVRRRVGRLAALIVGCDALARWCAGLIDQGFRCELEAITAKVFGSEALREGAIDIALKTHGGRAFLHGHPIGDHLHDYFAPSIYEGEGDILSLAFFQALSKEHVKSYFAPMAKVAGGKRVSWGNPLAWWRHRATLVPYLGWRLRQRWGTSGPRSRPIASLDEAVEEARSGLRREGLEISDLIRKHGDKLADRQCLLAEASFRVQRWTVARVVARYALASEDPFIRDAGLSLAADAIREAQGKRPTAADFSRTTRLGAATLDREWQKLALPTQFASAPSFSHIIDEFSNR